ncbi:MAG TPA: hypothetical protein VEZ16_00210 [Microvirga sp.]|nr:hypothetical protein [Microvirga sp.]
MNEITTPSRSSLPTVASRELSDLVARFTNALEYTPGSHQPEICSACVPSEDERRVMLARVEALDAALVRATEAEIGRMVSSLRAAFPAQGATDPASATLTVKLFMSALAVYPAWAISEACRRVLEGRAGINTAFAATPAQMAEICREIVAPFLEERSKITSVLTAKVYSLPTEEERRRVADGLAKLAEDLKRIPDERKRSPDDRKKAFLEMDQRLIRRQLALAGVGGNIVMSLQMRAKLEEIAVDEKYKDLVSAVAERRAGLDEAIGGRDDEAEGAGAERAGDRTDAGTGDVR